jgi:hypothetical protein
MKRADQGSRDDARRSMENITNMAIASCTKIGLAIAVHAAQDSRAGPHRDFPLYLGLGYEKPSHIIGDSMPSGAERLDAIAVTRDVISRFMGKCPCFCK